MFAVDRRVRVVVVAVAVLDAPVAPMLQDLDALAPSAVAGDIHRIGLAVVMRRIARCALALDSPAAVARHNVDVFLANAFSLVLIVCVM